MADPSTASRMLPCPFGSPRTDRDVFAPAIAQRATGSQMDRSSHTPARPSPDGRETRKRGDQRSIAPTHRIESIRLASAATGVDPLETATRRMSPALANSASSGSASKRCG